MPATSSDRMLRIVLGAAALIFLMLCLAAAALYLGAGRGVPFALAGDRVALLDLEGIIVDSKDFIERLEDYGNQPGVRAVVLRINSPGGTVAASQEIYAAVRRFRARTRKHVVVSMSTVAASGAYYAACAADKIYANPGSITGSIGVIAEWYNYGDLLRWAKLQDVVIKSGEFKDAGSPTRPLTEAERAYFQGLIDTMYAQFVAAVAAGRRMEEAAVRKLADGRIFTGEEARRYGLVDAVGTLQDAVAEAARMAGIRGEPRIVQPARRRLSLLDLVLGEARAALLGNQDRSQSPVRFQYLWR